MSVHEKKEAKNNTPVMIYTEKRGAISSVVYFQKANLQIFPISWREIVFFYNKSFKMIIEIPTFARKLTNR
ncbi:hypothetical protein HMPREF1981_02282 [Bacteroides pyogenes F0041]|uniref:Uncharacterized protein n=1 Tax=Bacteroides pyogenes F0041 TaxID=1321819 RepID=U2DXN3_9BACE|nr:hypothetical protein HMPREF1981_02282 [Bacteroides pyogenes F0041]GAE23530.1 hypothetical protein JCM10003_3313 [Bacteroides pyogenes JCM 10003]